jgi:mannosyl-oligosaccharide glucosidase
MFAVGGFRGLGAQDIYYQVGSKYWRGPVWINVNFMTLGGLYQFYIGDSSQIPAYLKTKARVLYNGGRANVVRSMYNAWMNTHYFYENYDDKTGNPQFNHPFNGWSSLILLIIAENYGI